MVPVITLHISSCWVALRPAELACCRTDMAGCVSATGDILLPQGAVSPGFIPFGGGGLLPSTWGSPNKGNADGTEGIFGHAWRVWAPALRPDPPKKRPGATLVRLVGRETNTAAVVVSTLPVFVYVEPRKPSSETLDTFVLAHHISVLSYLFIDP